MTDDGLALNRLMLRGLSQSEWHLH